MGTNLVDVTQSYLDRPDESNLVFQRLVLDSP